MMRKLPEGVTRLPTAAPRMVENHRYAAQRAAKDALRAAQPWPGKYEHHQQREAMRTAETLRSVTETPELRIVTAIIAALDDDTRIKVLERLAPGAVMGGEIAIQAFMIAKTARMTIGEKVNLDFAFRRLDGEVQP